MKKTKQENDTFATFVWRAIRNIHVKMKSKMQTEIKIFIALECVYLLDCLSNHNQPSEVSNCHSSENSMKINVIGSTFVNSCISSICWKWNFLTSINHGKIAMFMIIEKLSSVHVHDFSISDFKSATK